MLWISSSCGTYVEIQVQLERLGEIRIIGSGSHGPPDLNDGAEPACVSHITDADGPVILADPVCGATHVSLTFTPLHPLDPG